MRRATLRTVAAAVALTLGACSGGEDTSISNGDASDSATTIAATTTLTAGSTLADDVLAWCRALFVAAERSPSTETASGVSRYIDEWQADEDHLLAPPDDGGILVTQEGGLDALMRAAAEHLADAATLASSGDSAGASLAAEWHRHALMQVSGSVASTGGDCAGASPAAAAGARVNIPLVGAWQVADGFGTMWVSRNFEPLIDRIDPATGAIVATVDVGSVPVRAQAAGGRMWVRTRTSYVGVDPDTNTVVATLAKADVGPAANFSWASGDSLWICDDTTVHRYDLQTLTSTADIAVPFQCGVVYAGDDLVVASTYNQDDGESGTAAAAFIDLSDNTVQFSVDLPVDVNLPVVLADTVYFPGVNNDAAVTVDRASGKVSNAPSLGRGVFGGRAYDGRWIYVTAKATDQVLVVDDETFEVVDVIETLGVNGVEVSNGSLWVANNVRGFVQAFDRT